MERSKSNRSYCSKSCAAIWNNAHKKHGTRRSRLEVYLEERLRETYPTIVVLPNDRTAIGAELDLYLPEFRLAFELNGPVHYEPIYGRDKFERVKDIDSQKMISCYLAGIELCVIDVSKAKYLTQERKDFYWSLIDAVIQQHRLRVA